jgi:hypothetical protein
MTIPEESGGKRQAGTRPARVKRPEPARSGPIRSGAQMPGSPLSGAHVSGGQPPPEPVAGLSPRVRADINLDERLMNKAVANAVRTANQVLLDTVAQGRVAAEQFRHGEYNMRDVPVDLEIMGKRMIKLTRELSDTALNILEQLLKQVAQAPAGPPPGSKGSVPPFPTGSDPAPAGVPQAPPSSHAAPAPPADNRLELTVAFAGEAKAKALPSPLWKPSRPTLPSELSITPMMPMAGTAKPITGVTFEADLNGRLIATVTIPDGQPAGVYAGMILPANADAPLGVLTIEIVT